MSLQAYLLFSLVLFSIGLYAVLARRNLIAILIGIELMLNAASLNFMAFGRFIEFSDGAMGTAASGPIFVLFIIGLAAAEVAIALSIVIAVYRQRSHINVDALTELRDR